MWREASGTRGLSLRAEVRTPGDRVTGSGGQDGEDPVGQGGRGLGVDSGAFRAQCWWGQERCVLDNPGALVGDRAGAGPNLERTRRKWGQSPCFPVDNGQPLCDFFF